MKLSLYEIALIAGGFTIIDALIGTLTGYRLSKFNEKLNAASKFRSTIIYALTGFYPIDQHRDKKDFHQIYDSIFIINGAAAKFRCFVISKTEFEKAVSSYNKYCRETTYDSITADPMT